MAALLKSWPGLSALEVRKVNAQDCQQWAGKYAKQASPSNFNNTIGLLLAFLHQVAFECPPAIENGHDDGAGSWLAVSQHYNVAVLNARASHGITHDQHRGQFLGARKERDAIKAAGFQNLGKDGITGWRRPCCTVTYNYFFSSLDSCTFNCSLESSTICGRFWYSVTFPVTRTVLPSSFSTSSNLLKFDEKITSVSSCCKRRLKSETGSRM